MTGLGQALTRERGQRRVPRGGINTATASARASPRQAAARSSSGHRPCSEGRSLDQRPTDDVPLWFQPSLAAVAPPSRAVPSPYAASLRGSRLPRASSVAWDISGARYGDRFPIPASETPKQVIFIRPSQACIAREAGHRELPPSCKRLVPPGEPQLPPSPRATRSRVGVSTARKSPVFPESR